MNETGAPEGNDHLWNRTRERLERERGWRSWLRSRPTPVRRGLALGVAAAVGVAVAVLALRTDVDAHPTGLFGLRLALLALGIGAAVWVTLHPVHARATPRGVLHLLGGVGLLVPVLIAALGPAHGDVAGHPESFAGMGNDFLARAIACFAYGMILALPLLVLLRIVDRRDRVSWPRLLLLAAAGGLLGNLALLLHCPLVAPGHLLAGHATVPLGALVLLRLGTWRRRAP